MFHVHLRRRCILLHLNGMSWRYQWQPSHLMYHLRHVSLLIFGFDDSSTGASRILNLLLLLCYCQFLLLCLLVFVLCIEVFLCWVHQIRSDQINHSVVSTLCDPMNRSTPGLPVHHQLPEFTQTHVHRVSDVIQPSHPLSSLSPPAPNPSQHQSLFQWVNSSHEVAKDWSFSFSIIPSKEIPGLISFRMDWLDLLAAQGTLKNLLQHHSSKASILWCSPFFMVQLSNPYMTTWKTTALPCQQSNVSVF